MAAEDKKQEKPAPKTSADVSPPPSGNKPNAGRRRWVPFALVLIFIVLVAAGGAYYWFNRDPDCAALTKEATELMKKKDYKVAYAKLQPHAEACGSTKSKLVTDNNARLEYDYRLAVSAHQSGHKDEAKKAAQEGINVTRTLNNGLPSEDKDEQGTVFDLITIAQGKYYNYRKF